LTRLDRLGSRRKRGLAFGGQINTAFSLLIFALFFLDPHQQKGIMKIAFAGGQSQKGMNMTEETRVKSIVICAAIMLFPSVYALAGTLKTFDAPEATQTYARGISGNNIVGYYTDTSGYVHGFIYDGTNWTILNKPGAEETKAMGIDGDNIVGRFYDDQGTHTFLYDGTNWTTISENLAPPEPYGISGGNIVGIYRSMWNSGFIYNIATETCNIINSPFGWTEAYGIDGDNIVGVTIKSMETPIHNRGFLYDGTT
jgi:hypothetical protein